MQPSVRRAPARRFRVVRAIRAAALSAAAGWLVLAYGAQTFRIQGASMAPALRSGERVLVNKIGVRLGGIGRGDVVVFHDPADSGIVMVKRIVAVPGDTVRFRGDAVSVAPAPGEDARESPAARPGPRSVEARDIGGALSAGLDGISITVDAGHYFALGDNRRQSTDSRHWGLVPRDAIFGRVVARVFPPGRISWVEP